MNYDNFIVGLFPVVKALATIGGNQTLKKGCVLGKKNVSAGAKEKVYFGLSSLTPNTGTVAVTIGEKAFSVDTDTESTIDGILDALAAAVNADTTCEFAATADKTNDRLYLEAKAVGAAQHSVTITMSKTGTVTITIGSKTSVTTGTDPSNGEYYAVVAAADDGTQYPRAVLLEDVTVANGDTAKASVAFTGEFNKAKLSFGSTDTWATHEVGMRDRGMFIRDVVPTIND